jgi:predicted MFS family arabinose efflux permease
MGSFARSPGYRWVTLGIGTLVLFAALGLSRFSYTAILPFMQEGLKLSNTQAGGLASANLAGYLVMALIGGALASHLGPRRVIPGLLVLAAVGMSITGLAGSYAVAAVGRVLAGMGCAASVAAAPMMAHWFSERRRGLATGFVATGASFGLVVSGPLVPRIVGTFGESGWRVTWYILAAAVLAIAVLSLLLLRDRPGYVPEGRTHHSQGPRESWKRLYFRGTLWHLSAVYFAFGFAYLIYVTFFTKRLMADLHYSPEGAGNLFMILGLASLVCGVFWGWTSDAIGRKASIMAIFLIQVVSYALFALWTTTAGLTISAVLFGLTAWGIPAIMAAACGDIVGPALAPAAYGFLTVFHGLGQATGPYVGGRLADALPSFTWSYLLAAGMALVGAIGALLLPRRSPTAAEGPCPGPQTAPPL